jgi:hypothetical protein
MSAAEMSGPVTAEERPAEKEGSPDRSTRASGNVGKGTTVENDNGQADGQEKEKEKSEDKDSKAWQQQDVDFAYEYVQLAQVRTLLGLHFTTQSTLPSAVYTVFPAPLDQATSFPCHLHTPELD